MIAFWVQQFYCEICHRETRHMVWKESYWQSFKCLKCRVIQKFKVK